MLQICSKLDRRRGRRAPSHGLEGAATTQPQIAQGPRREPAAGTEQNPVHQGTLPKARRAEQNRLPRGSTALPAHLSVSPQRHVVRRTHHHPRHHQKKAGAPPTPWRGGGTGDDPTDHICRGAPSYIICTLRELSSGPTPGTGYLSDSLTLIPTLRYGSSCEAGRPIP